MVHEAISISVSIILEKFDQIQKTINNVAAKIETAGVGMDNFAKNSIEMQVQKAESLQKDVKYNDVVTGIGNVANNISKIAAVKKNYD
ncbi:MAG: hypothetical protein LBU65_14410 [Planctomycetaceae bacterium]|jgi:hypothetical protein|nr:hypothetical protein [Planctomycetaceae bacterium]